jgi:hypothetical protein
MLDRNFAPKPLALDPWNNESVIRGQRTRFLVPVTQPILLISEIQRSGGTFLSQLLDAHPELHVHPSELHIGRPNKYLWPRLDIRLSSTELFEMLWEHPALLHARDGYSKSGVTENSKLPFVFLGSLQREIFVKVLENVDITNQRQVLDAYITSYFNAWIDYRGLYRDPSKVKYWATFVARLLFKPDNVERLFRDYPDGLIISIIREPVSWYASASKYNPEEYGDPDHACELWKTSTLASLDAHNLYPSKVLLLSFEDLISSPSKTVERLCRFAGLHASNTCLSPTFNGMPIQANSSFEQTSKNLVLQSKDRTEYVKPDIKRKILGECTDLLERANSIICYHRLKHSNNLMMKWASRYNPNFSWRLESD